MILPLLIVALTGCNSLFYHPDKLRYFDFSQYSGDTESLKIPGEGGNDLSARLFLPQSDRIRGLAVHFHGNAQNLSSHFQFFEWLTHHGFYYLIFDYRGYGYSDGTPSRKGLIADGMNVFKYIQNDPRFRELDVLAIGQSLGGAVVVPVLANNQFPVRLLLLDSTFSSYRAIARSKLSVFWLTWPLQWPLGFLVSDDLSPVDAISQIEAFKVFTHGIKDPVVPVEEVLPLYNRSTPPRELWKSQIPGHTQTFLQPSFREKLIKLWDTTD